MIHGALSALLHSSFGFSARKKVTFSDQKVADERGFTIIEMLIVIAIISILSSLGIPMLSNQIGKARSVEATINVNACKKLQKAFFAENSKFATSLKTINLPVETKNFIYAIDVSQAIDAGDPLGALACCMAANKRGGDMTFQCISEAEITTY